MSDPSALTTLIAFLAGIWLGFNFGILVLVPALAIGIGSFAFCSFGGATQFLLEITLSCGLPVIAVQCGYVVGLTACETNLPVSGLDRHCAIQASLIGRKPATPPYPALRYCHLEYFGHDPV